jgi:hypothetical protein
MRSFRWLVVTGAVIIGVAVIAIAIGAIVLNSFIHSPGFKEEVETRAAQSIGGPVQIEAVDFDVWHGIKLKGLVTQIDASHAGGQGALKVNVEQVNCTYSIGDLLARKLRLTGVILDKPQITLTKQPTEPMPAPAPAASPGSTVPDSGSASGSGGALYQFVLDRAKVNDGSLTVLDASGSTVADLQGVNASADTAGYYEGRDITGSIKVAKITASNLTLTDFSTPFTYRTNNLSAKPFAASAFSGRLAGDFVMDNSGPSVLNLNGDGLNVAQLTAATSSSSSANLSGSLDVQSKWRGIETGELTGEGDAQLSDGKLSNVKMLQDLGSAVHIDELKDPDISKATTHFIVHNRYITFNGLQVASQLFSLTGNGTVAFDGALHADLVLLLTRDAMSRLPKQVAQAFVQQPDGTGSIGFQVNGTTSNPSTDLPERLVLQGAQKQIKNELNKALNKFFK